MTYDIYIFLGATKESCLRQISTLSLDLQEGSQMNHSEVFSCLSPLICELYEGGAGSVSSLWPQRLAPGIW